MHFLKIRTFWLSSSFFSALKKWHNLKWERLQDIFLPKLAAVSRLHLFALLLFLLFLKVMLHPTSRRLEYQPQPKNPFILHQKICITNSFCCSTSSILFENSFCDLSHPRLRQKSFPIRFQFAYHLCSQLFSFSHAFDFTVSTRFPLPIPLPIRLPFML